MNELWRRVNREAWGWRWLDALAQDLRFAVRLLGRAPLFTAAAVVTLGLGIGGNTLVFSLLEAVVLRPLPYADPDRLFMLWTMEAESQRAMVSSYPNFRDWQEQSRAFEAMAAFHGGSFNLTGGSEPDRVDALYATPGLFEVLGISPVLGRPFERGDDDRVALLSHGLWLRRFGGDAGIIGRGIQLDGRTCTVLGVLPPGFHFPPRRFAGAPEVFAPLGPNPDRTTWSLQVIGRLRPGMTERQARAEMNAIAARLKQAHPATQDREGITLEPLRQYVAADVRDTALVLLGAVGFVLLIACVNVANLLLSRGAARRREMAIRTAIGASRARVLRQLLTESLLLASFGGALGIALAHWGLPLLAAVAPERTSFFTRVCDAGVHLNATVLAFTAAVSVLAGVLFGILPAFKSTAASSSVRAVRHGRLRGALVAIEVGLCFVLLAGAGLMINSLLRLLEVDLGFRTERLLTMYVRLPEAKYPAPGRGTSFFRQALERLGALPGVLSAGGIVDLPLTRAWSVNTIEIEGATPSKGRAVFHAVSPGYFGAMGIPLLRGRLFNDGDSDKSARIAIINRSMASKYWPGEDPIGRAVLASRVFRERTPEGTRLGFVRERLEIAGVVGDVRHVSRDADVRPEMFMPHPQRPSGEMSIVLRTAGDPASLIPVARKEIWRVDPDQPVTDIKTMDEWVSADVAPRRFVMLLTGVFAIAAVVLAAVGIYGVVSYAVAQRTQEIGVRMALGAQRRDVMCLVLRQGAGWLALGIMTGIAGAAALTRLLEAHLYGVKPRDPATFVLVALALVGIALLAHAGPACRAARVDPVVALRHE